MDVPWLPILNVFYSQRVRSSPSHRLFELLRQRCPKTLEYPNRKHVKQEKRSGLFEANLQEADLRRAQLSTIRNWKAIRSMSLANIHGLEIPPEGFLAWAADTMNAVSARTDEEWTTMKAKAKEKMET